MSAKPASQTPLAQRRGASRLQPQRVAGRDVLDAHALRARCRGRWRRRQRVRGRRPWGPPSVRADAVGAAGHGRRARRRPPNGRWGRSPGAPVSARGLAGERPAPPVDGRQPVAAQRDLVQGRGVALVALEVVGGEVLGLGAHDPVAHHLGQHGGGGHRRAAPVAAHHRHHRGGDRHRGQRERPGLGPGLRRRQQRRRRLGHGVRPRVAQQVVRAVDQQGVGPDLQRRQGPVGGEAQGGGHAPPVALPRGGVAHGAVGAPGGHLVEDPFPARLVEQLRVAQPRRHGARRHAAVDHHHPHAHRAGPGPPAHLVQPGHPPVAGAPEPALLVEPRPGRSGRRQRARARHHRPLSPAAPPGPPPAAPRGRPRRPGTPPASPRPPWPR